MRTLSIGLLLVSSIGAAHASSLSIDSPSAVFGFSGYNGQPSTVTGVKSYAETGILKANVPGILTFTYLGQESGFLDSIKFDLGSGVLTEANPLGASISKVVGAGAVGFSFMDDVDHNGTVDHTFTNGTTATGKFGYAFLMDKQSTGGYDFAHSATIVSGPNMGKYAFDYILGFNDFGGGDSDYDDYVVGVSFTPSPVPLPAAAWLFGSALFGFVSISNRRKI